MHGVPVTDRYLAGDLIGFTAGLVITVLLLALTIRARRIPGTPFANILLVACALAWNVGGLARVIAQAAGVPKNTGAAMVAAAVQFSGAAVWPVPLLAIWRPFALRPWQRLIAHALLVISIIDAVAIVSALWVIAIAGPMLLSALPVKEFTSYNASLLALGAVATLAGRPSSRPVWFSSLTILIGIGATTVGVIIGNVIHLSPALATAVVVGTEQSTLLILLGTFFLFARFRFADVFIRQTLRILLASVVAVALVLVWRDGLVSALAGATTFPRAAELYVASILTTALLLTFGSIGRRLGAFVDRWIVRTPDYPRAARDLRATLHRLHDDGDILVAARDAARRTLDLDDVRIVAIDRLPRALWPAEIFESEGETAAAGERDVVDLCERSPLGQLLALPDAEMLVPVRVGGEVTRFLAITPGPARQGLVTHEIDYLRSVAMQCGARLDALRLERELVERENREALLRQQLTEAELRALRAQINPHFLFNALNTIADLIVTNPTAAEAMTLRLARVFRHVLAQSVRPLTSIGDEIEFVRAYLQIEEARFGGRLHVSIDVRPDVASDYIPSLILQPLVENALKHGLGPKPGPGHLWVSAQAQGRQVRLTVEDDGVGTGTGVGMGAVGMAGGVGSGSANGWRPFGSAAAVAAHESRPSTGVGLANIAQRLTGLYEDRASVWLTPRDAGGTCVTILLPRLREST